MSLYQGFTIGLYARARKGEVKYFTGIDHPYEPPSSPEIHVRTDKSTPEECATEKVIGYLRVMELIPDNIRYEHQ